MERRRAEERPYAPAPAPRGWAEVVTGGLSGLLFGGPGFMALLAPVPLLIGYRRRGWLSALMAVGVGFAVATLLGATGGGLEASLRYLVAVALPAGILGWAVQGTRTAAGALQLAGPLYFGALTALAFGVGTAGEGLGVMISDWVDDGLESVLAAYREQALERASAVEALTQLQLRKETYQVWGTRLFPGMAASAVALNLWLNLVYSRWFTGTKGRGDDLSTWRMPMGVMYAFMASVAGLVVQAEAFGPIIPPSEQLSGWSGSLLVFGLVLYWLQGVAVANYYFLRLRLSPLSRMLGVGLQAVLMLNPGTTWAFCCAGLFDAWFDLRRFGEGESGRGSRTES